MPTEGTMNAWNNEDSWSEPPTSIVFAVRTCSPLSHLSYDSAYRNYFFWVYAAVAAAVYFLCVF